MGNSNTMKKSLFLFACSCAVLITWPAQAAPCPQGNLQETAYMERDNDKRCEGVGAMNRDNYDFALVSFNIGRIAALSNPMKLQVPNRNNQEPTVRLRSFPKNYQLDPLALRKQGSRYQFQWDNNVIRNAQIEPESLRATAFINAGRRVYLPVLLSPNAGQYDIVLYGDRRAKITDFKILQNNQVIYSTNRQSWQPKGQIFFSWNGKTTQGKPAPQGLYQLQIKAQLEQDDAPPEPAEINITFAHDPQWLK
jgi:flagellar basal-body rod modification protein FlgD